MDRNEQFSKWVQAIEEALSGEKKDIAESMPVAVNECGCGSWDCPQCFPEQDQAPNGAKPAQLAVCQCAQGAGVCPLCGGQQPANQGGELSPMSIPPMAQGEVETEVGFEDPAEFDGELEELSEPTLKNYRNAAIDQRRTVSPEMGGKEAEQYWNRSYGLERANDRLGYGVDDYAKSDEDDFVGNEQDQLARQYWNEPSGDSSIHTGSGPYGGRNDDFYSNLTARGFEEESEDPTPEPERSSDGRGVKLGSIVQSFVPTGEEAGDESPLTHGEDNLGEEWEEYPEFPEPSDEQLHDIEAEQQAENPDISAIMNMQVMGLSMSDTFYDERELYTLTPEQLQKVKNEVMGGQSAPMEEDDMMQDAGAVPAQTGGSMGGTPATPTGGSGGYAPGTAPTMPESIQEGKNKMEIDKDIQRVLEGFKKYDTLKESKNVMEKGDNPWEKLGAEKKEEDPKSSKTHKGGEVTKTETGLKHKGTYGDSKKDVKESTEVDPEVLEWMQRFAKLGRMG